MPAKLPRKSMALRAELWKRIAMLSLSVAERSGQGRLIGALLDEVVEAGLPIVEQRYRKTMPKAASSAA